MTGWNLPPGVTGGEPEIAGVHDIADRVLAWLNKRPLGSTVEVIARGLGVSERDADVAIVQLVDEGFVDIVRHTKTSIIYGVVKPGEEEG